MKKVVLSADCACDIGPELKKKYNVHYFYFHVQIGEGSYLDIKEVCNQDIYNAWKQNGVMPKTAALSPEGYRRRFRQWTEEGCEVIHMSIGSSLSSAHRNSLIAADGLEGVYPIDSGNLSAGIGLLVLKAGEMIKAGKCAKEIYETVTAMRERVHAAFVVDNLEYIRAGGRCSNLMAMGANLLCIKPCIRVLPDQDGKIIVGKKYRGSMERVLCQFAADHLSVNEEIDYDTVFITNSGSPHSDVELVEEKVRNVAPFSNVHFTQTSSTISVHCGPRTLGIGFMTKS